MSRTRWLTGSAVTLALTLGLAAAATAQTKAGEVSRLEGTAAVARAAAPQGAPLKVKDDVLLRDLLTTGQQSKAQLTLGSRERKAIVTMREQSSLRITEAPNVSTVEMTDGLLKLAVLKDRMKPGERIDVKTPNAITAVRGTTIVVQVVRPPSGPPTTRLTVLNGVVEITPIDPVTGAPRGAPVRVSDLQQTTVTGGGAPTPPQPISRPTAVQLDATFAFKLTPTATSDDILKRQLEQAASDAAKVQDAGSAKLPTTGDSTPTVSGDDLRGRNVTLPTPPAPTAPPPPVGRVISPRGQ
jgi:FecR protein